MKMPQSQLLANKNDSNDNDSILSLVVNQVDQSHPFAVDCTTSITTTTKTKKRPPAIDTTIEDNNKKKPSEDNNKKRPASRPLSNGPNTKTVNLRDTPINMKYNGVIN